MKSTGFKAVAASCFMFLSVLAWSAERVFELTISTPAQTVNAGKDIPLYLEFTNVSTYDRFLVSNTVNILPPRNKPLDEGEAERKSRARAMQSAGYAEMTNHIVVLREDGTPATYTPYGRQIYETRRSDDFCTAPCLPMTTIPAGGKRMESTLLNKLYDMSKPGTYTIRAEHQIHSVEVGPATIANLPPSPKDVPNSGDADPTQVPSQVQPGEVIESNTITLTVTE
jgi:hypothetical protein